jgi:hypothetical protein
MRNGDYSALISASGKLKLKATALLAYGDEESRFEAAVLFHDAARIEARALALLPDPSPDVRLANAIERCGCFIEGFDFAAATRTWDEVERLSLAVPPDVASALRARVEPLYQAARRAWDEALSRAPVITAAKFLWDDVPEADRPHARDELAALLALFPGDLTPYVAAVTAAIHDERLDETARAFQRVSRLWPDRPGMRGFALLFLPIATPATEVEETLASTYEDLLRHPTDAMVYLGFIVASLSAFFSGVHPEVHRARALWAAEEGAQRPSEDDEVPKLIELAAPFVKLAMEHPKKFEPLVKKVLRSLGVRDLVGPTSTRVPRLMEGVISGVTSVLWPPPLPLAA